MLKFLQARLQQYMNHELPDIQASLEKAEIKLPTSVGSSKSKRVPEEHLFLLYWLCHSLWLHGSQLTVENSERVGNTRPPDLPLEKSVCWSRSNTGHGTTDWFQIGKWVCQGCILSPCLFKFYAEYIMRSTGLDEAQTGIKIAGRNINNLRYAEDNTLMAESEEELKSLLMKEKVAIWLFQGSPGISHNTGTCIITAFH